MKVLKKKLVLAVIGVFMVSFIVWMKEEPVLLEDGQLLRQQKGEGEYEAELILKIDGTEETEIIIIVPEQTLTEAEERTFLDGAVKEIEETFAGNNESFSEIQKAVKISESYQNGMVSAEWKFGISGLVDEQGVILEEVMEHEMEDVKAEVNLTCEDSSMIYEFYFTVYKSKKTEDTLFYEKLNQLVKEIGEEEGTQILWLPEEFEGHSLIWKGKKSKLWIEVFMIGIVIVMLLPALEWEKEKKERINREESLIRAYPEMVNKVSLLLGAGMSLRRAWKEIAERYQKELQEKQRESCVLYEEMLITLREIESGKGEKKAYEDFGVRCGLQKYRKFSNYLTQNLKKGNNGLCELLECEAREVFAERKMMVRQEGEKAGTKLLLPMILMLGIVIFIIMIPAILSFESGISS